MVDTLAAGQRALTVNTTISTTAAVPFSAVLTTKINRKLGPRTGLWMPWGRCEYGEAPIPWRTALDPEPVPASTKRYRYGAIGAGVAAGYADTFAVPMISVLEAPDATGFSLLLSPEDPLLELSASLSPGGVGFSRELLRLSMARPVSFSARVVGHAASWRPAMQFATDEWRPYFYPWVENAVDFEGLGSYSWNQEPYNVSRARAMGFKTNWDLSGTWMPYDGLFLPYQEDWLNLGPINGGLAQYKVVLIPPPPPLPPNTHNVVRAPQACEACKIYITRTRSSHRRTRLLFAGELHDDQQLLLADTSARFPLTELL